MSGSKLPHSRVSSASRPAGPSASSCSTPGCVGPRPGRGERRWPMARPWEKRIVPAPFTAPAGAKEGAGSLKHKARVKLNLVRVQKCQNLFLVRHPSVMLLLVREVLPDSLPLGRAHEIGRPETHAGPLACRCALDRHTLAGVQPLRLFRSAHGQGECHAMAQGGRSRTRAARHRQGIGSGWCSWVMSGTATTAASPTTCSYSQGQ